MGLGYLKIHVCSNDWILYGRSIRIWKNVSLMGNEDGRWMQSKKEYINILAKDHYRGSNMEEPLLW